MASFRGLGLSPASSYDEVLAMASRHGAGRTRTPELRQEDGPLSPARLLEYADALYAGCHDLAAWDGFIAMLEKELRCRAMIVLHSGSAGDQPFFVSGDAAWSEQLLKDSGVDRFVHELIPGEIVLWRRPRSRTARSCTLLGLELVQKAGHIHSKIRLILEKRNQRRQGFDESDIAIVRQLSFHMSRAFLIYRKLSSYEYMIADYSDAMNGFAVAAITLNSSFQILNYVGDLSILFDGNLFGVEPDGTFFCSEPAANAIMREAFVETISANAATAHVKHRLLAVRTKGRKTTLSLAFKKMSNTRTIEVDCDMAVKFYLRLAPAGRQLSPDLLRSLYGLTGAEAAVALGLASGNPLGQIAVKLGIKLTTARTHLSAIFLKMNVNRQAMVVQTLLSLSGGR